jgi:polyhydroxybutyrate depolymerase
MGRREESMRAKHCLIPVLILEGLLLASCGGSSPTQPTVAPTPACVASSSQLTPGGSQGVLISDGLCRQYLAHVPPSYDGTRPMPLVIAMHGYTGDPSSMEAFSGLSSTADERRFIIVYPAGRNNAWDLSIGGIDIRFLRALIAALRTRANVDARRIYVTGHSMGGAMAVHVGCELADVVAAVAPASGGHPSWDACAPVRPIAILVIHGTADQTVPPEGRPDMGWPPLSTWVPAWAQRNHCAPAPVVSDTSEVTESVWPGCAGGSEVRLKLVKGLDHGWWWRSDDELWSFFSRHSL